MKLEFNTADYQQSERILLMFPSVCVFTSIIPTMENVVAYEMSHYV